MFTPEELEEALDFAGSEFETDSWTKKVKTKGDLLKLVKNLDSLVGRKGTIIPKNDSPDEEWQKFYQDMRANDDEYAEIIKDIASEHTKGDFIAALRDSGISARQAKALSGAMKKAVDEKYTKHYSPESFQEMLKGSGIENLSDLSSKVNEVMGKDWMETRTSLSNDNALDMIKFAKGLTEKYAVKTPIEPKAKPTNGNPSGDDPFLAAFNQGIDKVSGWKPNQENK